MPIIALTIMTSAPGLMRVIDGEWETACLPIGENGRHGVITRIAFDGEDMQATAQVYATRACLAPTFMIRFSGAIKEVAEGDPMPFSYRVTRIDLTPQDQAVVDQYNRVDGQRHGCGLSGWKLNSPQSVAGQECTPFKFATAGTIMYDSRWTASDGSIRFGAFPMIWSNDTSLNRPAKPIPVVYVPVNP